MAIITSKTNAHVYIKILDNFPSIKNWFGDEVIFQDNTASCNRGKGIKVFLQEKVYKINDKASK